MNDTSSALMLLLSFIRFVGAASGKLAAMISIVSEYGPKPNSFLAFTLNTYVAPEVISSVLVYDVSV